MHIILEYTICLFAAAVLATLVFAACVTALAVKEGGRMLARTSRKLTLGAMHLRVRWLAAGSRGA
jgi:hypothetical protein